MDKNGFKEFCRAHGLRTVAENRAVGQVGGYLITVVWASKSKMTVLVPAADGQQKQFAKALKSGSKAKFGNTVSVLWNTGYLAMYINIKKMSDPYTEGVLPALEVLRSTGFAPTDTCAVCGRPGGDMAAPQNGGVYAPAHKGCLEGSVEAVRDKARLNAENGSYLLGFIGAVLGMLVGIIPSLFTIIALNRIYVLLFMLIPMFIYAGYKLLKGKMNYTALVLSILLSVVGLFAIFYIQLIYALVDEGLTVKQSLDLLSLFDQKELLLEIVKTGDFVKCAIFEAVGIALAWGQISRTSKNDISDAEALLGSAIPLSSGAPASDNNNANTEE